MALNYCLNDIILTKDEFGKKEFVIVGICEDFYICKKGDKKYHISPNQITQKIGEYIPIKEEIFDQLEFCLQQAAKFPKEKEKWEYLAVLKPNDKLNLIHRKILYPTEFIKININKPTKPIQAKMKGKAFNFSLDALDLDLQQT